MRKYYRTQGFTIVVLLVLMLSIIPPVHIFPVSGGLSDSLANATVLNLGSYNDTINEENDAHYYNFSSSFFKTYNFTVTQLGSNELNFQIYDANLLLLRPNDFQPNVFERSITIGGKDQYIIWIGPSGNSVYPVSYALTIEETQTTEDLQPGHSLASAINIGNGTFSQEDIPDYALFYNLTVPADRWYNVSLEETTNVYSEIYIFNTNGRLLFANYFYEQEAFFVSTGYTRLIILIPLYVFIDQPHLVITDITASSSTQKFPIGLSIFIPLFGLLTIAIMVDKKRKVNL